MLGSRSGNILRGGEWPEIAGTVITLEDMAIELRHPLFAIHCLLQMPKRRIRPVSARFQAFSGCQFHGMSSSMRLIL